MSELGKNVTGNWIKATAAFGRTPSRIPVQLFVEGDDDVKFWEEAVSPYQTTYDIRVVTNKAVNPDEGNGKSMLLTMDGLCENKITAVDADFDTLIDGYSPFTDMVRNSPYVVNTTWHSLENVLMQKTGYVPLLEAFSLASYDLFVYYLFAIVSKVETRPIKHYGEMLSQFGIQRCANRNEFAGFESLYRTELAESMKDNADAIAKERQNLCARGYEPQDVWKLTRGHNLWDMIVKPQIENDINNKISDGIRAQHAAGLEMDKIRVMNDMGITTTVKDHIDHEFYYGDMTSVIVPTPTREKLDAMFPS